MRDGIENQIRVRLGLPELGAAAALDEVPAGVAQPKAGTAKSSKA